MGYVFYNLGLNLAIEKPIPCHLFILFLAYKADILEWMKLIKGYRQHFPHSTFRHGLFFKRKLSFILEHYNHSISLLKKKKKKEYEKNQKLPRAKEKGPSAFRWALLHTSNPTAIIDQLTRAAASAEGWRILPDNPAMWGSSHRGKRSARKTLPS